MTEADYKKVFDSLVSMAVEKTGISERAARLRIGAIVKSGILNQFGPPDGLPFQVAIDAAMRIPQLGEKE